MRKCKQVHFIQGTDLNDLEAKLNEALLEGAELGGIDIASLTGAIIVTEYVGEIKKTALDELEEELGRHNCSECPFFEESTDKRRKWHTCTKEGKKALKDSNCCTAYYELIREEVKSEVSDYQGEDEGEQDECRGCGGIAESISAGGVRQAERKKQVPSTGMRITFGIIQDSAGGIIQGGVKC